MELKKLKCPECGANFESDEKVSFCSHCGAKLYFDDGTKNLIIHYKTEDITRIKEKEIELNREIELKKMKEDKIYRNNNNVNFYTCFFIFFNKGNHTISIKIYLMNKVMS